MAAASAGNDSDLPITDLVGVSSNDDLVRRRAGHSRVKQYQPFQHFFDDIPRKINELFHDSAGSSTALSNHYILS